MKILIINKSAQIGGAAVAAKRLLFALLNQGLVAKMLVYDRFKIKNKSIHNLFKRHFDKLLWWYYFILERLYFLPFEKSKDLRFAFSPAIAGKKLHKHKEVNKSNILHLHWFNQGYLSLKGLEKLSYLEKPIVWTLHDMWAFTGGCHYNNGCYNYINNCGNCIFLKEPRTKDLSNKLYQRKKKLYQNANITFVACSDWMKNEAQKSQLLVGKKIVSIPNPIDTKHFCIRKKEDVRVELGLPLNKSLILFGAANVNDERKGIRFLHQALSLVDNPSNIELVLFGKNNSTEGIISSYKIHDFGSFSSPEKLIKLYQAADLFILPSIQDNLPNTIMESISCGTPVVAFNVGGVPQMIDHKVNGYLAMYKSAEDLAAGIKWVLDNNINNTLGRAARNKVLQEFSEEVVAQKYIDLYESLLNEK